MSKIIVVVLGCIGVFAACAAEDAAAVVAHFTLRRAGASTSLGVEVSVQGGEWEMREEFITNPHRVQPYRLAVAFREPIRKGMIAFRYRVVRIPVLTVRKTT